MASFNFPLKKLFDTYSSIIVLDTETSGLDPKKNTIIEISCVKLVCDGKNAIITDKLDYLIKLPEGEMLDPKIVELTHITDIMLKTEGLSEKEVCEKFSDLFKEEKILIVAYNAQFDMNFLFYFLARHNKAHILKKINMLDALTVYKDRHDYPHKLENAIVIYNLEGKVQNSHRAIDDTLATVEVLKCMDEELSDLEKYINLFGYNPKFGISMQKISSVTYKPQGYKRFKKLYEEWKE